MRYRARCNALLECSREIGRLLLQRDLLLLVGLLLQKDLLLLSRLLLL